MEETPCINKDNAELLNPFNDLLKDTSFIEGERIKWKNANYLTRIDEELKDLSGSKSSKITFSVFKLTNLTNL